VETAQIQIGYGLRLDFWNRCAAEAARGGRSQKIRSDHPAGWCVAERKQTPAWSKPMNIDLLGSIELTASAAIVIAALSLGFGSDFLKRLRLAAALAAWFAVVVILAVTRALHYQDGLGTPGLGLAVALPVVILCLVVARTPWLREALHRVPLWVLIGVHTVRVLGIMFLILYAAARLPAPFAPVAGWGDIFVGVAAPVVAWRAYRDGANAGPMIRLWNVIGVADLIAAVGLGVMSSPGPLRLIFSEPGSEIMATLPWLLIPGFLVPLLFATHIGLFVRLAETRNLALASA
jgi:hypothetical protein